MFYSWIRVIQILCVTFTAAKHKHMSLRWDSFECQVNTQFVGQHNCWIVQPKRSLLSVELNLLQELESVRTYTRISTRINSSNMYRKLFDITFDGCRVIADVSQSALVAKIYKAVVKSSNQSNRCPIKKGLIYYHNISIEEVVPTFVPVSSLLVQVTFSNLVNYYLNVTVKGSIKEI